MKKYLLLFTVLSAATVGMAATYSTRIDFVLQQLRRERETSGEPLVAGRSYGYGGANGAFFILGPYVLSRATAADVLAMRDDPSPIVRILAAKIMSEPGPTFFKPEAFEVLLTDRAIVMVGPLDTETNAYKIMTVADVVVALRKNRSFLPLEFDGDQANPGTSNH